MYISVQLCVSLYPLRNDQFGIVKCEKLLASTILALNDIYYENYYYILRTKVVFQLDLLVLATLVHNDI